MVRPGGEADKLGNRYEGVWAVDAILDLLDEKCTSIEFEPLNADEGRAVEFVCTTSTGSKVYLSAKRQYSAGTFSFSRLGAKSPTQPKGILGTFAERIRRDLSARIRFVTQSADSPLIHLPLVAAKAASFEEFQEQVRARSLTPEFNKVKQVCDGAERAAFQVLRCLTVEAVTEEFLIHSVEQRIALTIEGDSAIDPFGVRTTIADGLVLPNLGRSVDRTALLSFLAEHHLRPAASTGLGSILPVLTRRTSAYRSRVQSLLIQGRAIPRPEAQRLYDAIVSGTRKIFIEGAAGSGKSAALDQFLSLLSQATIPHLAIRLDELPPLASTRDLGVSWGLKESPVLALARASAGGTCVLVLDQFDALGITSSRNQDLWRIVYELLAECDWIQEISIVLACRSFDLEHDPRLRELLESKKVPRIVLDVLPEDVTRHTLESAQVETQSLSRTQIEMLRLPQNLYLFLQISPDRRTGFRTVKELLDRYWDTKEMRVSELSAPQSNEWTATIAILCESLSRNERLSARIDVLDTQPTAREAMLSESVIVRDNSRIAFFHETFFDYAFARGFARQDRNLAEWLSSEEQSLFRRSQVRQILEYRRDGEDELYLRDLLGLLRSQNVRFHIKQLVLDWLRALRMPTRGEWQIVLSEADSASATWRNRLLHVCRNSPYWFDVLTEAGTWDRWLSSPSAEDVNRAVTYLAMPDVMTARGDEAAAFLRKYRSDTLEWQQRLVWVACRPNMHCSVGMQRLFIDLLGQGLLDEARPDFAVNDDFWSLLYSAATAAPVFCAEAVAHFLDRWVVKQSALSRRLFEDVSYSQGSAHVMSESAKGAPEKFADELYPRVLHLAQQYGDESWPPIAGNAHQWQEQLLSSLEKSMAWLASNRPDELIELADKTPLPPSTTASYLLLKAWAANPKLFAERIAKHLVEEPTRLDIEYVLCLEEDDSIAANAVHACGLELSDQSYSQLESVILNFTPEDEKRAGAQAYRGITAWRLLNALPATRLSEDAKRRIGELNRKFGERRPTKGQARTLRSGWVGSPLPSAAFTHMSNAQLIGAMKEYADDSSRYRRGAFDGGARELSRDIAARVQAEPERGLPLCEEMPEDLNPLYFSAILDGLVDSLPEHVVDADQQLVNAIRAVTERLHQLPGRPCGHAISKAIGKLGALKLSDETIETLKWYATSDPDPATEHEHDEMVEGRRRLWHWGSVREDAAIALNSVIAHHPEALGVLAPALDSLSQDHVSHVRVTASWAFKSALWVDSERAISLFLKAMEGAEHYWGCSPVEDFVYWANRWNYSAMRGFLLRLADSEDASAVLLASRQICVAGLSEDEAAADAGVIRVGSPVQRQGAAEVYASNAGQEGVAEECRDHLGRFFYDETQAVRAEAGRCFFSISPNEIAAAEEFIRLFVESAAFLEEVEHLAMRLEDASEVPGGLVAKIALRAAEGLGPEAADIRTADSAKAYTLSKLVLHSYDQCHNPDDRNGLLDAIDKMAEKGFMGIEDKLDSIER